MNFALNHPVISADGANFELGDVVIDPKRRTVTHAVIQPVHHHEDARLVPIEVFTGNGGKGTDGMGLRCTSAELARYPLTADVSLVGPDDPIAPAAGEAVGTSDIVAPPVVDPLLGAGWVQDRVAIRWDHIPSGDVEVRHASSVYSADEHRLGCVDGLVCDDEGRIVELVIKHGVVFGRRDVLVPAGHIARLENDLIVLDVTKHEAGRFEAQPLDDWLESAPPSR